MAIVIQEEKNNGSWFGFSILLVILVIVGISLYYLFFVQPEILEKTSTSLESIEEFSQMNFDPQTVIQSDFFKGKKPFIPLTPFANVNNPRPFGVQ